MTDAAEYYTVDHPLYNALAQGWTVPSPRDGQPLLRRGHVKIIYPGIGVIIETEDGNRHAVRSDGVEILERER